MAYTKTQLRELTYELQTDPLARGYSGMSDAAITANLNDDTTQGVARPFTFPVAVIEIEEALRGANKYHQLAERALERTRTTEVVSVGPPLVEKFTYEISADAVWLFMDLFLASKYQAVNLAEGYWAGLIDQMVADGDIGQGLGDGLKSLSQGLMSRAAEDDATKSSWPPATEADVAAAKAGQGNGASARGGR